MKLSRVLCFGLLTVAATACRTPSDSSQTQSSMPPGAVGMPMQPTGTLIFRLSDAPAQAMYAAFNAEEQTDQFGGHKSYNDKVSIFCERQGSGGNIPPGAQGIVAPASFNCSMLSGQGGGMPPGVQGMPMAPLLVLDGDNARAFYQGFKVQEQASNGNGRKEFQGVADISCSYTNNDNTPSGYTCSGRGDGSTPAEPTSKNLLSLDGKDAKSLYAQLKITEVNNVGGGGKKYVGDTIVTCNRTGGSIPHGAQGMPAAAKFDCTFRAPAHIPDGAQGFPGPGKILASFKTALAKVVYNGLDLPEEAGTNGVTTKNFNDVGSIRCTYAMVSGGKKNYRCSIASGTAAHTGGIPDGAQGMPVQPSGGGIPDGAQGMPVQPSSGGMPPGAQGMPIPQDGN